MAEKEITIEVKKPEVIILLIFLGFVLFIQLKVSFENPIVFGDEAFYARFAELIAENKDYPKWWPVHYTNMDKTGNSGNNLWILTIAGFLLFGLGETAIRFLPPFITFLIGLATFILAKRMYNEKVGFIASVITVTIPAMVTYSVLVYTDVLATLFVLMSFLTFFLAEKEDKKVFWIASGIFGALAFLTKKTGFTAYIFLGLFLFYKIFKEKNLLKVFKRYSLLIAVLILLPATHFLRNFYYYKTPVCDIPYISNFFDTSGCSIHDFPNKYDFEESIVREGTAKSMYEIGLMSYLNFAYGEIWFVPFSLCCGFFVLFSFRKKTSDTLILLVLLVSLIVFYMYGHGRAEDINRYTLTWAPYIALLSGMWFASVYEFIKKYQKYLALIVIIFVLFMSYQNLIIKSEVMASVKQFSPAFFEACDWVKENLPENVTLTLIWGHRAVYNCKRNAIGHSADIYLSRDTNYTKEVARQTGITHIFVQKFSIGQTPLGERYGIESVRFFEEHPETFKKVFENGPPLEQCLQQGGCDGNIIYEIQLD